MRPVFVYTSVTIWLLFFGCFLDAQAQQFRLAETLRRMRFFGPRQRPIFKTPADSIQLARIEVMLDNLEASDKRNAKRLDSLWNAANTIIQERLVRMEIIYWPDPSFTSSDSITTSTDLSKITKVSICQKKQIPELIFQCKNLKQIELVNTRIRTLPKGLATLDSLKTIRVYNNRPGRPLVISKNHVVKKLSIQGTDPAFLPRTYKKLKALETLELSENGLIRFPNGARKNKHLKELSLQRNAITLEKNTIKRHRYLERLALHENKIRIVPNSISNFSNLKKLNFNRNQITNVSDAIGKLTRLEQLSFYSNALTSIPKGAYALRKLKDVDLFHNQIEILDPEFANWKDLQNIFLSHNKLVALPDNLDTLKFLEGLYVWDNRLGSLPESLGKIKTLKYVRANKNYLKALPISLLTLADLEELDIAHNYITELPEAIFEFPKLKMLSIVDNPWNETTLKMLPDRVQKLRARDISVHLTSTDE